MFVFFHWKYFEEKKHYLQLIQTEPAMLFDSVHVFARGPEAASLDGPELRIRWVFIQTQLFPKLNFSWRGKKYFKLKRIHNTYTEQQILKHLLICPSVLMRPKGRTNEQHLSQLRTQTWNPRLKPRENLSRSNDFAEICLARRSCHGKRAPLCSTSSQAFRLTIDVQRWHGYLQHFIK